jgi:hypothetical protein
VLRVLPEKGANSVCVWTLSKVEYALKRNKKPDFM